MSTKISGRAMAVGAALAALLFLSHTYAQGVPARPRSLVQNIAALTEQVQALQTALAEETANRKQADDDGLAAANAYTDSAIAAEATARQAGDADALADANAYTDSVVGESSGAISKTSTGSVPVPFGSFTTIVSIAQGQVPAGSYVAHGIVGASLFSAGIQCDLEVSSLLTGEGFRTNFSMSGSLGVTTLSLMGSTTLSQPGRAFIVCTSIASSPLPTVTRGTITLIKVPKLDFP